MAAAPASLRQQLADTWDGIALWFQQHWLEILIGLAAGAAIVVLLHTLRNLGRRLCRQDRSGTGWSTILGRAVDKTGNLFIIVAAPAREG